MSVCIGNSCGRFVLFTQNAMKLWEDRRSLKDWFSPSFLFIRRCWNWEFGFLTVKKL